MNQELRWGILSTADIGVRKVIPALQKARRSTVVAIGSRDVARAQRTASALAIPSAYGSYEAVLADPDVDAVYIPLPNHLHAEWTMAAAAAGKHVLCEKPLALSSADAQTMADACERAGVRLMEGFMYRLHPSWVAVRELVASGRIGQLQAVQSWFSYFNDDPADIRNILAVGGGALYDIGCYSVNASRILFGTEPMAVTASVARDPQSGVDTTTSAILDFGPGTATFTCSMRADEDQRVHIYGRDGHIYVPIAFSIPPDQPSEVILTTRPGGRVERMRFDPSNEYVCQAEAFVAMIQDGAEPEFPISDAVANLVVIERIFAAGN
jgi:predicted dehydrogenase